MHSLLCADLDFFDKLAIYSSCHRIGLRLRLNRWIVSIFCSHFLEPTCLIREISHRLGLLWLAFEDFDGCTWAISNKDWVQRYVLGQESFILLTTLAIVAWLLLEFSSKIAKNECLDDRPNIVLGGQVTQSDQWSTYFKILQRFMILDVRSYNLPLVLNAKFASGLMTIQITVSPILSHSIKGYPHFCSHSSLNPWHYVNVCMLLSRDNWWWLPVLELSHIACKLVTIEIIRTRSMCEAEGRRYWITEGKCISSIEQLTLVNFDSVFAHCSALSGFYDPIIPQPFFYSPFSL